MEDIAYQYIVCSLHVRSIIFCSKQEKARMLHRYIMDCRLVADAYLEKCFHTVYKVVHEHIA